MNALVVVLTLSKTIRNVPYVSLHRPRPLNVRTSLLTMSLSDDAFADNSMHVNEIRQFIFDEIKEPAWVLIFDAGTPEEGVYTIEDDNTTSILAFRQFEDAYTFAKLLTKDGYAMATPMRWTADGLAYFCEAGGYKIIVVPYGHMLTPPPKQIPNDDISDIRERLENIYPQIPENCTDDDCVP